jgi:hypothetical protein
VHLHQPFAVRIFMDEHIAGSAAGTLITQYSGKVVHEAMSD